RRNFVNRTDAVSMAKMPRTATKSNQTRMIFPTKPACSRCMRRRVRGIRSPSRPAAQTAEERSLHFIDLVDPEDKGAGEEHKHPGSHPSGHLDEPSEAPVDVDRGTHHDRHTGGRGRRRPGSHQRLGDRHPDARIGSSTPRTAPWPASKATIGPASTT